MANLSRNTSLFALAASTALAGCMAGAAGEEATESAPVSSVQLALCPAGTFNVGAPAGSEVCVPNGSKVYSNPGAYGCPAGAVITPGGNVVCLPGTPGPVVVPVEIECPPGTVRNPNGYDPPCVPEKP